MLLVTEFFRDLSLIEITDADFLGSFHLPSFLWGSNVKTGRDEEHLLRLVWCFHLHRFLLEWCNCFSGANCIVPNNSGIYRTSVLFPKRTAKIFSK